MAERGYSERAALAVEALRWRVRWGDSNPEVGMGPSNGELLDEITKAAGVTLTRDEYLWVLARVLGV